jgi:hypothetical protein
MSIMLCLLRSFFRNPEIFANFDINSHLKPQIQIELWTVECGCLHLSMRFPVNDIIVKQKYNTQLIITVVMILLKGPQANLNKSISFQFG